MSADSPYDSSRSSGSSSDSDLDRTLESREMPDSVDCPFCDSEDTEPFSAFGSSLSVSQYYCNGCHTVFEWMKWRRRREEGGDCG